MVMNTRKNRARRAGFTLLEILLVVGLLALLAAFAIPALMEKGEDAKKDIARTAIGPNGPLMTAINLFKFDTGVFPEELKDLVTKPSDDKVASKWKSAYLQDIGGLKDPWGNDYEYNRAGSHNQGRVDLWSKGPDGIDGNDDDIRNWKDDR